MNAVLETISWNVPAGHSVEQYTLPNRRVRTVKMRKNRAEPVKSPSKDGTNCSLRICGNTFDHPFEKYRKLRVTKTNMRRGQGDPGPFKCLIHLITF